ncbi:MAG: alpha/beta hydrolase [Chitinophagaceae bacterium]|nr:MAG: alpha/beta hydrolase [Chitinophagaceae bacterium]
MTESQDSLPFTKGYAEVNGLRMYYEIHGQGQPLVLIHGGGSTIDTSFQKIIPPLSKSRQLIAVELQAHGRTGDRSTDLSFEQDADDVAALLKSLSIDNADFFGFSNGGTTALQVAIRYPQLTRKIILASALVNRSGAPEWFWDFMKEATLDNMPAQLKAAYLQVVPDMDALQNMHDKDVKRMLHFKDISWDLVHGISSPTLIVTGDKDVTTLEHAFELHKQIPNSSLAVIPGGHGEYIGELTTLKPGTKENEFIVPIIEKFLDSNPD